jgi:hypothetical protein
MARAPESRIGPALLRDAVSGVRIDRQFSVPGLARVSPDGLTVFIDSGLPFVWRGGGADVDVESLLALHERAEGALLRGGFSPEVAHAVAEAAERRVLEELGVSWIAWRQFLEAELERAASPAPSGRAMVMPPRSPRLPGRHAGCRRRER